MVFSDPINEELFFFEAQNPPQNHGTVLVLEVGDGRLQK